MNVNFREGSVAHRIYCLGQSVFESKGNKEIAALIGIENQGQISNERGKVAKETGWKMPGREATTTPNATATPKARRLTGSLPVKIQGFLEGLVETLPDVWSPDVVLPVVKEDSVAWNRFIRRMVDLDESMVESFERWLDHPATISRMAEFMVAKDSVKKWENKAKAETLAKQLIELGYGDKASSALLRELWI
jgi:hypothetical protein